MLPVETNRRYQMPQYWDYRKGVDYGCWKSNPSPLPDQPVLSRAEPTLHTLLDLFLNSYFTCQSCTTFRYCDTVIYKVHAQLNSRKRARYTGNTASFVKMLRVSCWAVFIAGLSNIGHGP